MGSLKGYIRRQASRLVKFIVFRILFTSVYCWNAKKPVQKNKVLFVEVHDPKLSDNFRLLYQYLKKDGSFCIHVHFLRSGFTGYLDYIRRCVRMLKDMADAGYVFLDKGSNVIGSIPMRKETILTQTWHACGAFKKFGGSVSDLKFGETEEQMRKYPYYGNVTYVTISSPQVAWAYEEAMMLSGRRECLKPVGVSRTDVFFRQSYRKKAADHFYQCIPWAEGRQVILYAPTFRGQTNDAVSPDQLDVPLFMDELAKEYVLVIKHHPLVRHSPEIPESCSSFAKDVTKELSIEELLCVSDICITDYSSLIFEYSLFERPMLFFAYDLDEYFDWRGFYYDYYELAPGPVVQTNEELIDYIRHVDTYFDRERVRRFREKFMSACDGHATKRILEMVFGDAISF